MVLYGNTNQKLSRLVLLSSIKDFCFKKFFEQKIFSRAKRIVMSYKVGDVYMTEKAQSGDYYYVVIQKDMGLRQGVHLYDCYCIYNILKNEPAYYPTLLGEHSLVEKCGIMTVVKDGQIPSYKEQFINLMPEFFI